MWAKVAWARARHPSSWWEEPFDIDEISRADVFPQNVTEVAKERRRWLATLAQRDRELAEVEAKVETLRGALEQCVGAMERPEQGGLDPTTKLAVERARAALATEAPSLLDKTAEPLTPEQWLTPMEAEADSAHH